MQYVYVVLQTKELQATQTNLIKHNIQTHRQYEHTNMNINLLQLSFIWNYLCQCTFELWKFTAKFGTIFKQKVHYKSNAIRMTILRYRIFRHTLVSYKDTEVSDSDNINVGTKVKKEMKPVFLYRSVL